LASELIYQAVRRCSAVKPVIASVSGMAASGGYYVAVGAPTIFADSSGIVGSIGVVSGKLALTGLFEKIGVTTYAFTRGRNAGMALSRGWTPNEREAIERLSLRTYQTFVDRVKTGRGERIADIDAVAQGRVFTARQAVKNKMIDAIGGYREATLAAQKAAGVESVYYIHLPRPRTLVDLLSGSDEAMSPLGAAGDLPGLSLLGESPGAVYLVNLARLMRGETVLAATPYYLSISR
jgi:protease-4